MMQKLERLKFQLDRLRDTNRIFYLQLIFFALLCFKGFDRLWYAGIWAEDGHTFLKQAFEIGWPSLFNSYAGYYHTLPRLIALVSSWFPVISIPYVIVLINYVIFTITVTLILKKEYKWLFPSSLFALLAALMLFLSPGQDEMLGNVTNLHWYLLLWLAILGLKDIETPYSVPELVFAFLCVASEGAVAILFPLYCARIYLKWKRHSTDRLKYLSGDVLIALFILIFTTICLLIKPDETGTSFSSEQFDIFLLYFFNFILVHPFIGDNFLVDIQLRPSTIWLIGTPLLIYCLYVWRQYWKKEHLLLLILTLSSLGLPIMISKARPENIHLLLDFYKYDFWFGFRYSFFVCAAAGVVWAFVLQFSSKLSLVSTCLLLLFLSGQVLNYQRFFVDQYGNNDDWASKAPILERSRKTGCPNEVYVEIYPHNWLVGFVSSKECEE